MQSLLLLIYSALLLIFLLGKMRSPRINAFALELKVSSISKTIPLLLPRFSWDVYVTSPFFSQIQGLSADSARCS